MTIKSASLISIRTLTALILFLSAAILPFTVVADLKVFPVNGLTKKELRLLTDKIEHFSRFAESRHGLVLTSKNLRVFLMGLPTTAPSFSKEFDKLAVRDFSEGLENIKNAKTTEEASVYYQDLRCDYPVLLFRESGAPQETRQDSFSIHVAEVLLSLKKGLNQKIVRRNFPKPEGAFIPCYDSKNSIAISTSLAGDLDKKFGIILKIFALEADLRLLLEDPSRNKVDVYTEYSNLYYHPILSELISDMLVLDFIPRRRKVIDSTLIGPGDRYYSRKKIAPTRDPAVFTPAMRNLLQFTFNNDSPLFKPNIVPKVWLKIIRDHQNFRDKRSFEQKRELALSILDAACRNFPWISSSLYCTH